jgi:autotransporter passenger strand-loop-strand repeat protein
LTISSGQTSGGVLVLSGGTLDILSGGTAVGTTVDSGGSEIVSSGGTASNTTVSGGGSLVVLSHGIADPATIYGGGSETVSSGGTDLGAHVSGGIQIDLGLVSGVTVYAGSQVVGSAGTAIGTTVSNGGTEVVSSGGKTSGTVLRSGQEILSRGAVASGTVISGGGEIVSSGGSAISGGTLEVASGGTASGVVFSSGGILQLDASSHLSGTVSGFHLGDEIDLRGLAFSSSSSTLSWKQTTLRGQRQRHADHQGGDEFHEPHPGRQLHGVKFQRDLGWPWRHTDHRSANYQRRIIWCHCGQFRCQRGRPWRPIDHRSTGVKFCCSDAVGGASGMMLVPAQSLQIGIACVARLKARAGVRMQTRQLSARPRRRTAPTVQG